MLFKIAHLKEIHMLNKKVNFDELVSFIKTSFKKLPTCFSIHYLDDDGDKIAITNHNDLVILYDNSAVKSMKLVIEQAEQHQLVREPEEQVDVEIIEDVKPNNTVQYPKITQTVTKESPKVVVTQELLATEIRKRIEAMIPSLTAKIQNDIQNETTLVTHSNVTCDGCGLKNITGARYKCSVCANFDYCSKCEASIEHPHAFLKIKHPSQAPKVLICSVEEDNEDNVGLQINGNFLPAHQTQQLFGSLTPKTSQLKKEPKENAETVVSVAQVKHKVVSKDRDTQCAAFLEEIFEVNFANLLTFVKKYPTLSKQELFNKWVQQSKSRRGYDTESSNSTTVQDRDHECASFLEEIFEVNFGNLLAFVKKHPKMTKQELFNKWVEESQKKRSFI